METKIYDDASSRIFCLSITEAERYFKSDAERVSPPDEDFSAGGKWWLRSAGSIRGQAAFVARDGSVIREGCPKREKLAVRPALRIILDDVIRA